ncbi:MAG: hypothetical protein AWU57_4078 [Marinobacter sp. T13-3]|jgi:hypothetical protein|nr:MAG: hypothetical protein AWU57_4078 [Marinobacter sp. T13-3]
MKLISLFALLVLTTGCATKPESTISYSGAFNLNVPTQALSNATFFSADGLSVAWPGGKLISGLAITRESEALPPDFELKDYPKYALGLKSPSNLGKRVANLLGNSATEFDRSFGKERVEVRSVRDLKVYSACRQPKCMAFVVKDGVDDHILSVYTQKINQKEFNELINGL